MAIALSINLNKIALIRNSRDGDFPNIQTFAEMSLKHGANGLTVHPRPDQRHIRPEDVTNLAALVKNHKLHGANIEFNIEGNPFSKAQNRYPGFVELVTLAKPDQCTLVPDSNDQKTSDHGFDLLKDGERLNPIVNKLKSYGCRVSLFMDPIPEQIKLAADIGADRIELYTGPFAEAYEKGEDSAQAVFLQHTTAAEYAHRLGLGVNAGHDLNVQNMQLYKQLPHLAEVSIGHALTVDALLMGWEKTIKAYKQLCS